MLACGFTPMHLQTFLAAHLRQALPQSGVEIVTGLYGDLLGTLSRCEFADLQGVAVALEWSDLDPRLGYRSLGGWGLRDMADVQQHAGLSLKHLREALQRAPRTCLIALSLPTLPFPPAFHCAGWQQSEAELGIQAALMEFAAWAATQDHVRIASTQRLAQMSPPASRFDFKAELLAGLPYTVAHADAVAQSLSQLIHPAPPKKGIITDLDDTLWNGIVGEVGAEAVNWDLASHSQLHGLYQQLLGSLADSGVLIAAASKNDPASVELAFAREDILLPKSKIFPMEIHWKAKSASMSRILERWNIAADSVVFVDDSPMELEEVKAVHPGIECLLFPKKDYAAAYRFLHDLRDLFGKSRVGEEDAIRLQSLRMNAEWQQAASAESPETTDALLRQAEAVVTIELNPPAQDGRVLELVNKTNQFNLNGRRYTPADWHKHMECPGAFVMAVAYRDKFGPLGKIAVLKGRKVEDTLSVSAWVMSCRAFSRRIEHQCTKAMFDTYGVSEIRLDYASTDKNGPLRTYFESLLESAPDAPFSLTRAAFLEKCPPLYHRLEFTS